MANTRPIFSDGSEPLAHHGVKGMKWGVRKSLVADLQDRANQRLAEGRATGTRTAGKDSKLFIRRDGRYTFTKGYFKKNPDGTSDLVWDKNPVHFASGRKPVWKSGVDAGATFKASVSNSRKSIVVTKGKRIVNRIFNKNPVKATTSRVSSKLKQIRKI